MNIVILGAPASGKGTQAELVAKAFNLYHLQTGAIARKLAEHDARISEIINSGKLMPEEEMSLYVIDNLKDAKPELTNILFEGFPRFISQYEALEKYLTNKGDDIDAVFSLDIGKSLAIKRISARRICEKCEEVFNLYTNPPKQTGICDKCGGKLVQREDDKPAAIETRFDQYEENTKELIDYLDKKGKLIRIDGSKPIDQVFSDIQDKLKELKNENTSKK
ncbi:MAG TPA: nucleoside monophosphate kinase [Patescibacteria group bacterium]|nr:nucleoside monophosphate kinase [Patescibacteria group bacterium]